MIRRLGTTKLNYLRSQAFAYAFASLLMFASMNTTDSIPSMIPLVIGCVFALTAAFYLAAPFWSITTHWAEQSNRYLSGGLYVATVALLILEALKTPISVIKVVSVICFLIILVVQDIVLIYRVTARRARRQGARRVIVLRLKQLSFAIAIMIFPLILFEVKGFGNPLLWLSGAVLLIAFALFLEAR
jgi:hypothetical protein